MWEIPLAISEYRRLHTFFFHSCCGNVPHLQSGKSTVEVQMWNSYCGSLPQLGCILVFSSHGLRIPSGRPQNTPKTSTMPSETYFSPCGATSFHFIIIEARSFDPCPFRKTVSRSFHDAPVAWKSTPTHHGLLTWAKNSKNKENRRCLKNDFHIW